MNCDRIAIGELQADGGAKLSPRRIEFGDRYLAIAHDVAPPAQA